MVYSQQIIPFANASLKRFLNYQGNTCKCILIHSSITVQNVLCTFLTDNNKFCQEIYFDHKLSVGCNSQLELSKTLTSNSP